MADSSDTAAAIARPPENPYLHARAEIRQQARAIRGLLALDDLLGETGEIEKLCRDKRAELDGLEQACAELEAKRTELAAIAPQVQELTQRQGELQQACSEEERKLGSLRDEVAALEAKKAELGDVEARLAKAKSDHADFLRKVGISS